MKIFRLLLALLALAGPRVSFAETVAPAEESDWVILESDSLPPAWQDLYDQIHGRQWVTADFVERRFFSFRRNGVELTGTVWFGRDEGLTLAYREPRAETVRIDEQGVRVLREDGSDRGGRIPEEGREIPDVLLALFHLNLVELEKTFEIRGRRDGQDWSLLLLPRESEEAPVEKVQFSGSGGDVERIEIEQSRSRRIELELSNFSYPATLDEKERARRFP